MALQELHGGSLNDLISLDLEEKPKQEAQLSHLMANLASENLKHNDNLLSELEDKIQALYAENAKLKAEAEHVELMELDDFYNIAHLGGMIP